MPFLLGGHSLTHDELQWFVIGDQMSQGKLLYGEIFSHIGPFSAGVYWFFSSLTGKSVFLPRLFAILLTLFQATFFNNILNRFKIYDEHNYLPAFIYIFGGLAFFDLGVLSPQLMGMTFILLMLHLCIEHVTSRQRNDEIVIRMGITMGIACLFWPIYFFLTFGIFLMMVMFSSTIVRRYAVIMYGLLLPIGIVAVYYYWHDAGENFFHFFVAANLRDLTPHLSNFLEWFKLLPFFGVLAALSLLGQFRALTHWHFNNRQTLVTIMITSLLVVSTIVTFLYSPKQPYIFLILIPWLSFYVPFFLLKVNKKWFAELIMFTFVVSSILIHFGIPKGILPDLERESVDYVLKADTQNVYSGKTVWVMGNDMTPYLGATAVMPYVRWKDLEYDLNKPTVMAQQRLLLGFGQQPPQVIIDQKNAMPKLLAQLPYLRNQYHATANQIWIKN
ncbi:DUF6427 family protein [Persicobacter psychrovividus]